MWHSLYNIVIYSCKMLIHIYDIIYIMGHIELSHMILCMASVLLLSESRIFVAISLLNATLCILFLRNACGWIAMTHTWKLSVFSRY